jgi:hypothetical protein
LSFVLAAPAGANCDAACVATKVLSGGMSDPHMVAATAALAAPILLAGAAVTAARVTHERPLLRGVVSDENGKPSLTLIPPADPEPWNARDNGIAPSGLPRPSVKAELIGTAVIGAAVLAGIIAGLAKKR